MGPSNHEGDLMSVDAFSHVALPVIVGAVLYYASVGCGIAPGLPQSVPALDGSDDGTEAQLRS